MTISHKLIMGLNDEVMTFWIDVDVNCNLTSFGGGIQPQGKDSSFVQIALFLVSKRSTISLQCDGCGHS